MIANVLWKMIKKFQETGLWRVRPEKGGNTASTEVIEDVALIGKDDTASISMGSTSIHHITAALHQSTAIVHEILEKML